MTDSDSDSDSGPDSGPGSDSGSRPSPDSGPDSGLRPGSDSDSGPDSGPDSVFGLRPDSDSALRPGPDSGSVPHSHCSACGARYPADAGWPRTCPACGTTAYRNPLPVAVALLPVTHADGTALLVITRTIPPQAGRVALPGGFVDFAEDWRAAVVRELREETGIEAAAEDVRLADALSSPAGHLLLFGLLPPRPATALPPSVATSETSGHHLLHAPEELAFPLHTEAVRRYFAGVYG